MSKSELINKLEREGHQLTIAENEMGEGYILVDYWTSDAYEIDFVGEEITRERDLI